MARPKSPVRLDWVDPAVCSLEYRLKIISRLPFFKHLPAEAISKINDLFHDSDVSADERIYFEGDEATSFVSCCNGESEITAFAIPLQGVKCCWIFCTEENTSALSPLSAGASTLTPPSPRQIAASCRSPPQILNVSSSDYPDVTRKVLEAVSQRLTESQEIVKQLSTYTAEQRIASALLRLARKLGEARGQGVLIQLPFSRQDLAAMTGSTTETVSRVMSRFAEDGLIKSGRKWVTITNIKRLEELTK